MVNFAPIVLFAFNRPQHLLATLDALSSCPEAARSKLVIFCDGAKLLQDRPNVVKVQEIACGEVRFASVTVKISNVNKGLATSVIEGVTALLESHERVIVLEDDMIVSPAFLKYMNTGLEFYASDSNVASICAYMYPINPLGLPEFFFLRGADCWGWATWRRAWSFFEPDGATLLREIDERNLQWQFDLDDSYPYYRMLKGQIAGKNSSWAIRWHASTYLRGMVSCFPSVSLLRNIGLDGSGTHCIPTQHFQVDLQRVTAAWSFPNEAVENVEARLRIIDFFDRLLPRWRRFIRRARKLLRQLNGHSR